MCVGQWQLEGHVARLKLDDSEVSVDVTRPSHGLLWQPVPSRNGLLNVLGIATGGDEPLPSSVIDPFARGCDLVVTYAERQPRQVRAQVYWRNIPPSDFALENQALHIVAAFDLILSVNTSALDDDPQSVVRSVISPAMEVFNVRLEPGRRPRVEPLVGITARPRNEASTPTGTFLVRLPSCGLSYVEIVHPSDYQLSDVVKGDGAPPRIQLSHQLFTQRLEKGVILRARVRAALVERQHDEAATIAGFERFSALEPPLTV
ncbi:MAG: hypothetical protein IT427_10700 [Pirellulales bacterium]|nr:hypothetical protein [Pirellulales bacterium]